MDFDILNACYKNVIMIITSLLLVHFPFLVCHYFYSEGTFIREVRVGISWAMVRAIHLPKFISLSGTGTVSEISANVAFYDIL